MRILLKSRFWSLNEVKYIYATEEVKATIGIEWIYVTQTRDGIRYDVYTMKRASHNVY